MKYLLKNGEVALSSGTVAKDLLIENGKIAAILEPGEAGQIAQGAEEIDCSAKTILPGFIDVHVHFRDYKQAYKEDWESGSKAALAGGITTVFDMPNNSTPIVSVEALEEKRKLVEGRSYVNYGLYVAFNGTNIDEINKVENVPGVKVYIANSTGNMGVGMSHIRELFEKTDKKIVTHAEDEGIIIENQKKYEAEGPLTDPALHSKIRSTDAAESAVKFVCGVAKDFPGRLHVAHVSCEKEVDVIAEHKEFGVTCEVAPHHLLLSTDDYETLGNFARMNPPVRDRSDLFAMWKNLKFGVIDIVATDHAPHTIEEKQQPYVDAPSGVPEEDTLVPIMMNAVNDEGMTMQEVLKVCCEKPAEIFALKNKGKIEEGFDADLVVVDMEEERKVERGAIVSKCGWSPYEGLRFKGWPVMTFVNGELKWKEGEFLGGAGGKEVEFA